MNPRRKKRLAITSSIIVAFAVATGLVLYALSQNIDLFYTPTEIVEGKGNEKAMPQVGQRLRVGGLVVPGTVRRLDDNLRVSFRLIDNGPAEVTVEYQGILPDLFREGQGIVAQGILVEPNRIVASEVLARHDEEYMPPELARQLKGIEHVPPSQWQTQPNASNDTEEGGGYDR
ncbi:cytochrome c maturation protein CcmE [Aliidiomarina celeris]|uniref:cytochrome c maturation protein CcmE n=1 Tax=Aliidiomarina celeris TaxID=2249428 RepID=UPI000DE819B7|nr:cytochrome c maturation protein CcmE [Aliidiomarina celeris]